jgi:hypothetical protein
MTVLPMSPHEIPKPKHYRLCVVTFVHNPLQKSHHSHINPTSALSLGSPYPLAYSRALFMVSCKTYQLTLPIYS